MMWTAFIIMCVFVRMASWHVKSLYHGVVWQTVSASAEIGVQFPAAPIIIDTEVYLIIFNLAQSLLHSRWSYVIPESLG